MKTLLITSLIALALTGGAMADDSAVAGRRILAKNQDTVVTVRLVVMTSVRGLAFVSPGTPVQPWKA